MRWVEEEEKVEEEEEDGHCSSAFYLSDQVTTGSILSFLGRGSK